MESMLTAVFTVYKATNAQQNAYAMAGFGVKEKVIFAQTFCARDSDGAGRAKHFATLHFLALLFPPLHKHRRCAQVV